MENAMLPTKPTVTMTSLELVDFINSTRKDGEAPLRHDHFMAKVTKVLGAEGLPKFRDTYVHPQNGQEYACYRFPKREACLMAMSYSYELQAKVFDRMTELEDEQQKPKLTDRQPTKVKQAYGTEWRNCPPRSIEEDFRKVEMLAQFADLGQADKLTVLAMTVMQHDEYFASVIASVRDWVKELDAIKLQLT
jgi:hypothetical protein